MNKQFKFFLLFSILFSSFAFSHPDKKTFEDGVIFLHIPKTAGTYLKRCLYNFFYSNPPIEWNSFDPHRKGDLEIPEAIKLYTKSDLVSSGHVVLRDLVIYKQEDRPIIVFLRDPLKLTLSFYRYIYYLVNQTNDERIKSRFSKFHLLDLNSIDQIRSTFEFNNLIYTSPIGVRESYENLTSKRVDECVRYILENTAFIGDSDHMEDSLYKLNLYLGLSLDVNKIVNTKENETPNTVEKITNPEVIAFFKEKLMWEFMFNERVFAGQRWKYGTPILKTPGERRESMTQYIMPEGFNPDQYLIDLGIEAEIEAKVGKDKWKKREAAMVHLIEASKEESRS